MRNILTITAALGCSALAGAATIYAPNNLSGLPDGSDSLIVFDSDDPSSYTTIGSMGVPNIGFGGLDFDADGTLWAYASFFKSTGGASAGLYRVDTSTGQATLQGAPSLQSLQDIAYNPVDGRLYGINSQNNVSRLYTIDLSSGATSVVGVFSGLPASQHVMGFAIDASGAFYVQEIRSDTIYKGNGLALTQLYDIGQDTDFSQGMTIDWSRDDQGYHGATGRGVFPNYFSQVNRFAGDGSGYVAGPNFGPNDMDGVPPVEAGDLAIMPVPEPAVVVLLALGAPLLFRRR